MRARPKSISRIMSGNFGPRRENHGRLHEMKSHPPKIGCRSEKCIYSIYSSKSYTAISSAARYTFSNFILIIRSARCDILGTASLRENRQFAFRTSNPPSLVFFSW